MESVGFGAGFLFIFVALAIIGLAIPVAMGVYVYKDANRRGMNAVLWTAVVVLVPSFIGLIIYLILRNEHSANSCPRCGTNVSKDFSVCPECGYSLKQSCPHCSHPLSYDWKICPNCANPVPEYIKVENPVKPKKDKRFKILLAVLIVMYIFDFIAFLACGFIYYMSNTSSDIVFPDEIMSEKADIIIDPSQDAGWVEINIDGYTDIVRSADVEFYADGKMIHSTGISAPEGEYYFESSLIIDYPYFAIFDSEYFIVSVSDLNGVIAQSDKIFMNEDLLYELKMQDDKLVQIS